jgi:nucleotidyltransferase substrate binding protein (TIGR01987 family)
MSDKLDLSSLRNAIVSLREGIGIVSDEQWFNAQTEAVRNTLIAGVIQNFEFVYELSIKMMRRRIEVEAASPTEADHGDFRNLLRTAAEKGLIADVEAWFGYWKMRNITAHTCDHEKATSVYKGTLAFIGDAQALLDALDTRNG